MVLLASQDEVDFVSVREEVTGGGACLYRVRSHTPSTPYFQRAWDPLLTALLLEL